MAETYVLWTPWPRPADGQQALRTACSEAGITRSVRAGDVRSVPMRQIRHSWQRPRAWQWRRRSSTRIVEATLGMRAERPGLLAERDVREVSALASALRRPDHLVLVLVPPPLLVEHLWRAAVWAGKTVPLADLTRDDGLLVRSAYDRLLDVTAAAPRRSVVSVAAPDVALLPRTDDPAWQLCARGVEILRRMNAHAQDDKERAWMREFCAHNYPLTSEPGPALDVETSMRLLNADARLAELWGRDSPARTAV
ncbi:MAG: hypothetical protein ACRDYU_08490 [Actinomycetes bacterium]